MDGRHQTLLHHAVGLGRAVGDVEPHGRQRVGEAVGILAMGRKQILQPGPGLAEVGRRRVVGRRQPTVGQSRGPAKPRIRAPAPHPDRRSCSARRVGIEADVPGRVEAALERWAVGAPEGAQGADRLVETGPTLLEVDVDALVVLLGGARTDRDDQPATGQTVDGGQGLGQRDRSANDREGHGRGQRHGSRVFDHRGQRGGPVEPRHREHQVIVHRQGTEAEARRGVGVLSEVVEGVGVATEVHQRQMGTEVHTASVARRATPARRVPWSQQTSEA